MNSSIPLFKRCTKCGVEYPATAKYFHRDKKQNDGLGYYCKECVRQYGHDYRERNREVIRARKQAYAEANREKISEQKRLYRLAHRDEINERRRIEYASDETKRKATLEHGYRWRQANPDWVRNYNDEYYAENRTEIISRVNEWQKRNPERWQRIYQAATQRRLARKRTLANDFNADDWQACLQYWDCRCAYCGNPPGLFSGMELTIDHVIPLSSSIADNPGTVRWNVVPACLSCNSSKNKHELVEWLNERFGKRKARVILKRIEIYFEWVKQQAAE